MKLSQATEQLERHGSGLQEKDLQIHRVNEALQRTKNGTTMSFLKNQTLAAAVAAASASGPLPLSHSLTF